MTGLEDEKRCDKTLWLCLLYMVAFLAFIAWALNGCATTTGGKVRQGLASGLTAAKVVEVIADGICKPALARCIAAKTNPCVELIACGKTKAALLKGVHGFVAGIAEANELTRGVK